MRVALAGLPILGLFLVAACEDMTPPKIMIRPSMVAKNYPDRTDWIVDQAPTAVPPKESSAGCPPLKSLSMGPEKACDPEHAIALAPEVGKNLLDPLKELPQADLEEISEVLQELFGSPMSPGPGPNVEGYVRPEQAQLIRGAGLYYTWCASCHGNAGGGDGPAATTLHPPPRDYRSGIFKFVTSNPDAAGKPRLSDIKNVIRRGIDGTVMPPFPNFDEADLDSIANYVQFLSIRGEAEHSAMKRLIKYFEDADEPDREVKEGANKAAEKWLEAANKTMIAKPGEPATEGDLKVNVPADPNQSSEQRLKAAYRGYKLFNEKEGAGCASCHINYGRDKNLKYDVWANVIQPRNLLLGQYRGGRSDEEIYARIYVGIAGSGMPSHRQLVDEQKEGEPDKIWDLIHFLRHLAEPNQRAKLRNEFGLSFD